MNWKKNAISYILWGLYLAAAVPMFFFSGMYAAQRLGVNNSSIASGISVFLILAVPGIFLATRKLLLRFRTGKVSGINWPLVQWITFAGLLAAGVLVRVFCLIYAGEEAAYYDAAMVAEGAVIPQVTHGAVYLYLQFLRLLFLVAGNKWMAGIWLQIVLQLAACVILYIGVRRLAGNFPALVMTAFLMLSPHQILQGLVYSPKMLYLCVYGVGLIGVASYLKRNAQGRMNSVYDILVLVFTGAFTAFVCYLDITGITLLLIAASVLWINKKKNRNVWGSSLLGITVLLLSTAGFFCAYLALDAYTSGKSFAGVYRAWQALYQVLGYDAYFWMKRGGDYIVYLVLFALMAVGAISFWYRKRYEKLSPWVLAVTLLCVFEYLHMTTLELGGFTLIGWMCAVLAGIGAEDMFYREKLESGPVGSPGRKSGQETEELVVLDEGSAAARVKYIENPLPLPKKHVKKVMDYGYDPVEQEMGYDVPVDEKDDFDIR